MDKSQEKMVRFGLPVGELSFPLPPQKGAVKRGGLRYRFCACSTKRVISEGTPRRQEKPFHRPVPELT